MGLPWAYALLTTRLSCHSWIYISNTPQDELGLDICIINNRTTMGLLNLLDKQTLRWASCEPMYPWPLDCHVTPKVTSQTHLSELNLELYKISPQTPMPLLNFTSQTYIKWARCGPINIINHQTAVPLSMDIYVMLRL